MTSSTGGQYNVEDFKQDVKAGKVTSVEITPNEETPTGVVRANYENKRSKHFNCTDIKDVEEIIKTDSKLAQNYVINDVDKPSWIITVLLPCGFGLVALFLLFTFLSAQMKMRLLHRDWQLNITFLFDYMKWIFHSLPKNRDYRRKRRAVITVIGVLKKCEKN